MKKILFFVISLFLFINNVAASKLTVQFNKCVDGDTATFTYKEEEIKTRFLAVDTPETKHPTKGVEPWGKEASDYTCNRLKNATKIVLEYDDNSEKKDKYERHLVWVWVDGKLLQKELINNGLAKVAYLYDDYKYTKDLQNSEKIAQNEKIGIWSDEVKVVQKEEKSNTNIDIINALLYKDGKMNYPVIIIAIIIIIIICLISTKIRKKVVTKVKRELKKEIKKQIKKD